MDSPLCLARVDIAPLKPNSSGRVLSKPQLLFFSYNNNISSRFTGISRFCSLQKHSYQISVTGFNFLFGFITVTIDHAEPGLQLKAPVFMMPKSLMP
jgi:hypothetical protein